MDISETGWQIGEKLFVLLDLSNDTKILYALPFDRAGISREIGCKESE